MHARQNARFVRQHAELLGRALRVGAQSLDGDGAGKAAVDQPSEVHGRHASRGDGAVEKVPADALWLRETAHPCRHPSPERAPVGAPQAQASSESGVLLNWGSPNWPAPDASMAAM